MYMVFRRLIYKTFKYNTLGAPRCSFFAVWTAQVTDKTKINIFIFFYSIMPSKEGDYMLNKRKNYIDNIRSFGVILVLIYHVFYIYNGLGVLGGVPTIQSVRIFDDFLTIVYPWMMILMFTAAGVAAKASLEKRTNKEFIRERARKLLIPSTLGLFVIHWITGYLNIYFGGGLNEIPHFLVYPISVLSGQGHLWFAQTLFLYSLILVFGKKTIDKFYKMGKRAGFVVCVSLSILIWLSAQIFNMPIITVYRFGIYCVSFLIGYCVFSHDTVVEKLEKNRYFSLILCIVFGIILIFVKCIIIRSVRNGKMRK